MNESIHRIIVRAGIGIIIFVLGASAGYFGRSSELREAQEHIRAATEASQRIEQRYKESQQQITEIEGIAEARYERIQELEEGLQRAIARARARDEIIAGLESEIKTVTGRAARIGDLAAEGKQIIEELMAEGGSDGGGGR